MSPNGKVRHASFGASGMAWSDITQLSRHESWELVAVADVDARNFERVKAQWPNVKFYGDWRELLEKEQLDSVNVSTPDHMHGPIGMTALQKGLHVYGQKPLTQTLHECRAVTRLAREKGLMTQMGIQVSSAFSERLAVQIIHDGVIGKVKEVHSFSNKFWGDMNPLPTVADEVPEGLNWDQWLGVAGERNYIKGAYHPSNWRKRRDFGTGTLGDMGCHMFSGWYRALGLGTPLSVKSTGPAPVDKDSWATDGVVEYLFPGTKYTESDKVKVTWYDGAARPPQEVMALIPGTFPGQGSLYIGTEGVLIAPHGSTPTVHPKEKFANFQYPKLEPRDHYLEFVNACLKGGEKPSANFDYSGPLTEAVLLGCLASVFPNETLEWDAEKLAFKNSEAATRLVTRDYRKGWEVAGL